MANATVNNSYSYKVPVFPQYSSSIISTWKAGRCIQGSGFSPFGMEKELQFSVTGFQVNLTTIVQPSSWYWAQCTLTGTTMAGLLVAAAGLLCCCCICAGGFCYRKRKQQRRTRLEEPILVIGR